LKAFLRYIIVYHRLEVKNEMLGRLVRNRPFEEAKDQEYLYHACCFLGEAIFY
jgi:hypothetical protein